jgi:hypothetical protein
LDSFPFLFFRVQFKRKFLPLLCQVFYNDSAHQDKFRFNPAMQRARQKNLSDGLRAALNAAVPIGFVPPGSAVMASKRRRDLSHAWRQPLCPTSPASSTLIYQTLALFEVA